MSKQIPGQAQAKVVQGPIDRVPCPWCGKANDFRIMEQEQLLDTGGEHWCDYCGMSMEIVAIKTIQAVAVRKNPKGGRAPQAQAAARRIAQQRQIQQQQQKPGLLQRLLGKGK